MRKLLCLLFLTICGHAFATAHFVRSGATGSGTGADWTNAWTTLSGINWGSVSAGDTIYVAAGTYTGQLNWGASGTSGNPVTLEAVESTDTAATGAAGWSSAYIGPVTQTHTTGTDCIYINNMSGYIVIDGRTWENWKLDSTGITAGAGVEIDGSAPTNVTLRYLWAYGPGTVTQSGDCRGFDLTPTSGTMSNLTVQYCESGNGGDANMYLTLADNALVEHCSLHDANAVNNTTYHQNAIYCGKITNSTIRYNAIYDTYVEGIFFGDPSNSADLIYDNLFYQGTIGAQTGAAAINFDNASSGNSGILIYNNTFVDLVIGIQFDTTHTESYSGCKFENNIVYNCGVNVDSTGWTSDYNAFSGTTSETHSIGSIANTFTSYTAYTTYVLTLASSTAPIGAALNLGSPYNVDYAGTIRPASGAWDIGAYEYAGVPATPGTLSCVGYSTPATPGTLTTVHQ